MHDSIRQTLTRRRFVGGSALLLGGLAGCDGGPFGRSKLRDEFDVCVIGSGFAGTMLARRLVDRGLHTVLLEAASSRKDLQTEEGRAGEFTVESVGAIDYPVESSRILGVGGTSGHWSGVLSRLTPSDFREHSLFGLGADWPLEYSDLDPYYCEAEELLWARGRSVQPGQPPRQCSYPEELEEDYRPPSVRVRGEQLSFFQPGRSVRGHGDRPVRLAEVEIPEFVRQSHATLLADHQVVRLVPRSRESISHVEVRAGDGSSKEIRAKSFVLAAGVLESPRLLLWSRSSEYPEGLGNTHDLVGRFLNVHPTFLRNFEDGQDEAIVGTHRSLDFNDEFRRQGLSACHVQIERPRTGVARVKVQPEMEARPENRITLSGGAPRTGGPPTARIALEYSERDRRTIEEGTRLMDDVFEANGIVPAAGRAQSRWRFHPSGTLRMGFDETNGVVDSNGRVFGMENLYVSGACVFPTAGTANPTLTVVAMTLRLADHLTS